MWVGFYQTPDATKPALGVMLFTKAGAHTCGEGACPRWVAKRPQNLPSGRIRYTTCNGFATASQSNGGEPPRHRFCTCLMIVLSEQHYRTGRALPVLIGGPGPKRGRTKKQKGDKQKGDGSICAGLSPAAGVFTGKPPATRGSHRLPNPRCNNARTRRNAVGTHLWRGGLPPLGREAAPKPAIRAYQVHHV